MRTELKEIVPFKDVQKNMNKVVKVENDKIAAIDSATAAKTVTDGIKQQKLFHYINNLGNISIIKRNLHC